MAVEIERKFLVSHLLWSKIDKPKPSAIIQGYLTNQKDKTVRIRLKDQRAFLTIKGSTKGISRLEFEYEIPLKDAKTLLEHFCDKYIQKKRYKIAHEGLIWEVDEFEKPNNGLILAEVELTSESEKFVTPKWVEKEVSQDPQYFNANMLK